MNKGAQVADVNAPKAGPKEPVRFVHRYLASVLALASHNISAEFHVEVRKAGLTVTEWRILGSLFEAEGETVGDLARLAITKQPTLSKVLPRLEAQGLVTLETSRVDRRQTVVRITPKGTLLISSLCDKAMAHQQRVLAKLGPDYADRMVGLLRAIITD
ncbi:MULTISPECIES: MarR family winged helix-turn-helix transcriptional regulator [unclassified Pusillimonas]|uniref:MarR family winged helix-turn-helix transcriptional regulator n=1 Tax=unclassified Pusillimonas TaxID=2640016 RepID=UPI000B9D42BE|nr:MULTISPECIES: MarR family transcriptional regulator [unclassified Pusillimonas]OXR50166.1 MarR family transcriptional regulator [Pusillimonas sp. T2]ROT46455.1 MarR family transcriptional regulator [Pusillimonas sp. NJUB218]